MWFDAYYSKLKVTERVPGKVDNISFPTFISKELMLSPVCPYGMMQIGQFLLLFCIYLNMESHCKYYSKLYKPTPVFIFSFCVIGHSPPHCMYFTSFVCFPTFLGFKFQTSKKCLVFLEF